MATQTLTDSAGQRATDAATSGGDSTLADLRELFRKSKQARERFIPDWYLNTAFYLGHQWLYWNHGMLDRPQMPKYRETLVDNRIQPIVLSRAARKVKNRPTFSATPFTGSEEDVDAARITEKVMEFDWVYLDLQHKLFDVQLSVETISAGFWKIYWDSTLGEKVQVVVDQNGQPAVINGRILKAEDLSEGLPPGLSIKEVAPGDVCVDVVSPFHFYPDPLATSMDELEWCVEEKVRSPDYLKQRYNVDLQPDTDVTGGPTEARLYPSQMFGGGTSYKGVRVYEFWAKPSPTYPKGKRCVWAQQSVLAEDDAPFDPCPYVMFSGIQVPSRFWPDAITTQLRGPQINLNKIKSQIQENANRIGNPALMQSRQANVHYSGVPGEKIFYDSTVSDAVPQYLQPPEVPTYVKEQEARIIDSMTEISGQREVSNATVPTGVTAASAINLLQEADDTRIGPEIQDMEKGLGEAGTKIAKLRAKYNSDERLIRIAGEDGNWDIFAFRGAMMGEEPTVECQAGSAMPRSKAAKQAAMLEVLQTMFQYGLVPEQRDLRMFFKDYEVGALDRLFGGLTATERQIQAENRRMTLGEAVDINAYDVDQDHIDGHEEYQRGDRYRQLSPEVQQLIETHVQAHREKVVQQTQMQLQAQASEQAGQATQGHQLQLAEQTHAAVLDVAKEHAMPREPAGPNGAARK